MVEKNIAAVEAYYDAMSHKNLSGMAQYLHPNVQLTSPFGILNGKEAVLTAATKSFTLFDHITMRAKFGHDNQVMVVFNLHCPDPVGIVRSAVLISFKDNLIATSELFYDTQTMHKNT